MAKRKPGSELNDRNWDIEEEPEEAGTFQLAGEDVMKNRTIRKARRTIQTSSGSSGGLFSGFALKSGDSSTPKPSLSTGVTLNFGSNLNFGAKANGTTTAPASTNNNKDKEENPEYLRQLKTLNENILTFLQKHVRDNPYCILTPTFKDYEKHLSGLEQKYGVKGAGAAAGKDSSSVKSDSASVKVSPLATAATTVTPLVTAASAPAAGSLFGKSPLADSKPSVEAKKESSETKGTSGFSFGAATAKTEGTSGFSFGAATAKTEGTSGFSFGAAPAKTEGTSGFSFGAATTKPGGFGGSSLFGGAPSSGASGFSFGAATASTGLSGAAASSNTADGDDEYEPPKAEVREIKEDGATYTKRCKLFHQKDGQWADRGVGNIHLKPTDTGKTQLIVRADTNLGNILLNILLTAAIPCKRQGKNNVFIVCTPNPPIDPNKPSDEPVPMLLRVKTGEDADDLLAQLEEAKGSE